MIATWKSIKGYEGHYQVSDSGAVRSVDRYVEHPSLGTILRRGKPLKAHTNHIEARVVALCRDGKAKQRTVHSLVADAFFGPKPEWAVLKHKNGDKSDNRMENLEYRVKPAERRSGRELKGARETCRRGHMKGISESYTRSGCQACERATTTVHHNKDLAEFRDQIADIHYKNILGANQRLTRANIESILKGELKM